MSSRIGAQREIRRRRNGVNPDVTREYPREKSIRGLSLAVPGLQFRACKSIGESSIIPRCRHARSCRPRGLSIDLSSAGCESVSRRKPTTKSREPAADAASVHNRSFERFSRRNDACSSLRRGPMMIRKTERLLASLTDFVDFFFLLPFLISYDDH